MPSDWNKYKQLRNETKSALNKSYWSHVHDLIDSKNPKRFWSFIKTKTKSKSIPPVVKFQNERSSTASDKAELFNNFFVSVFSSKPEFSTNDHVYHSYTGETIQDFSCPEADVEKLLLDLNTNKACGPDVITARMLRESA